MINNIFTLKTSGKIQLPKAKPINIAYSKGMSNRIPPETIGVDLFVVNIEIQGSLKSNIDFPFTLLTIHAQSNKLNGTLEREVKRKCSIYFPISTVCGLVLNKPIMKYQNWSKVNSFGLQMYWRQTLESFLNTLNAVYSV